jgi:hypothetical protein
VERLSASERPHAAESRTDKVEEMLAEHGHEPTFAPIRVAFGKSGIAVGFPKDPVIHVSWWLLLALATIVGTRRRVASSR